MDSPAVRVRAQRQHDDQIARTGSNVSEYLLYQSYILLRFNELLDAGRHQQLQQVRLKPTELRSEGLFQ